MPPSCRALRVSGVDMHIGSQITELQPFDDAFALLSEFVHMLRADGHAIEHVDLGGGLGIPYRNGEDPPPDPRPMPQWSSGRRASLDCTLIFEPGRLHRRQCRHPGDPGALCEARRGEDLRHRRCRHERPRPPDALRGPSRGAPGQGAAAGRRRILADVVGPVCESGDFLALDRTMAEPAPGDLLAVMTAGAYGAVQAGTYNTRPLVAEVMVKGNRSRVVRPRIGVDEIIALDRLPDWM